MARRSYDQYCPIARSLDVIGERWALLIVRELLAGPRRYTDLHADLPGVSTDVLASRLKELERDELVVRRRLPAPAAAVVYDLTERGRGLWSVLAGLADWGAPLLAEPRPTDAVRAHWAAIPLLNLLPVVPGVLEVHLDEGVFHLQLGGRAGSYADGPAERPDARLTLVTAVARDLFASRAALSEALTDGRAKLEGDEVLVKALSESRFEKSPAGSQSA